MATPNEGAQKGVGLSKLLGCHLRRRGRRVSRRHGVISGILLLIVIVSTQLELLVAEWNQKTCRS
jgi:hypothetical protein